MWCTGMDEERRRRACKRCVWFDDGRSATRCPIVSEKGYGYTEGHFPACQFFEERGGEEVERFGGGPAEVDQGPGE